MQATGSMRRHWAIDAGAKTTAGRRFDIGFDNPGASCAGFAVGDITFGDVFVNVRKFFAVAAAYAKVAGVRAAFVRQLAFVLRAEPGIFAGTDNIFFAGTVQRKAVIALFEGIKRQFAVGSQKTVVIIAAPLFL